AAGERLARQVMREGDMVARRAGDQFAVLLRESTPELAHSVAQRIALAFEQPLALDEHRLAVPVGVGIACWPGHADSADTLVHRAERAMLAAKRGRSGPLVYEPAMDDGSAQSLALLDELREALARGELRLHLQPKLSMATGGVAGAEALLRWQHPRRGLLPPGEFIPFAEQTGLVRELTLWVFEACARTWRELQAEGADMVLSLNLSARDLLDAELPARLEKRLLEQRVPAEAFCLEITEGAFLDDPQRALATLKRLSLMGFKLSIDDFGAGLSSYAWLKQLPVDELKIDTAFVRNMDRDPVDAKLVRSMIELAHNLGFGVVAEGVENARTWELLRELSCEQAQGFHMGRPMPVEEFLAWSARWVDKRRLLGTAGSAGLLH
ncbi:MAG: bifunctional diguanylate cyclase/phosphodiesterase, partial [Proteobacteria bacterium]|nr:bifunctional diguanylate cyclase/phosphodiesterase [Pseudomonadota bacterium]